MKHTEILMTQTPSINEIKTNIDETNTNVDTLLLMTQTPKVISQMLILVTQAPTLGVDILLKILTKEYSLTF